MPVTSPQSRVDRLTRLGVDCADASQDSANPRHCDVSVARTFGNALFAVSCNRLRAGLSSPSDDYVEGKTDLNVCLGEHPAATFPCDHHSFIPLY